MYSYKNILLILLILASFFALINGYNSTNKYNERIEKIKSFLRFLNGYNSVNNTNTNNNNSTDQTDRGNETIKSIHLSGRIVNGTAAFLGQFPQQVSLRRRYSQSHFCGGNVIAPGWILTAAHCMFTVDTGEPLEPYSIIVVAGEIILKHTSVAHQWRFVSDIIVHPKFDNETLDYDVALLQLKEPLEFNDKVRPAPFVRNKFKPGTICQVSGWGYQEYEGNIISGKLLYVDVPLMSASLCRTMTYVPKGSLCAGYLEGQKDACTGDSGGGLVCDGFLTGIVSGGSGCAQPKSPGLYADVKYHTQWIKKYVVSENIRNYFIEHSKGRSGAALSHQPLQILSLLLLNLGFLLLIQVTFYNKTF